MGVLGVAETAEAPRVKSERDERDEAQGATSRGEQSRRFAGIPGRRYDTDGRRWREFCSSAASGTAETGRFRGFAGNMPAWA